MDANIAEEIIKVQLEGVPKTSCQLLFVMVTNPRGQRADMEISLDFPFFSFFLILF